MSQSNSSASSLVPLTYIQRYLKDGILPNIINWFKMTKEEVRQFVHRIVDKDRLVELTYNILVVIIDRYFQGHSIFSYLQ